MNTMDTIQKIVTAHVDGRFIKYDDILIESGIDSVLMIEIIMKLEEKFNVEFDLTQLSYKTLKSIRTITEYIELEIGATDEES